MRWMASPQILRKMNLIYNIKQSAGQFLTCTLFYFSYIHRVCRPNHPFVQPHLKQTPLEHVSLTILNLSVSQSLTGFHHHSLP